MKEKIKNISRFSLGLGIFLGFSLALWSLWRLWQQSQIIDPETLESLLPSLNMSLVKEAAALLR